MATIVFDTYAYIKKLRAVGFTEEQAAVQTETLANLIDERLVTKQHFDIRMKELDVRLKELETSLRHDMKELEVSLRHELKELESRIIIKLGAMMAASIAVIAALVKVL